MRALSTTLSSVLLSKRQRASALLPCCPRALSGTPRQRASCVQAHGSVDQPSPRPGRPRRTGGGSAATPRPSTGRQPRRRGTAGAASGPADAECSEYVVLLDLLLPAAPSAVAQALFAADAARLASESGDSIRPPPVPHGLLVHHMQQSLGHLNMAAEPWQPAGGSAGLRRRLRYDTPLSGRQRLLLPFGPAAVHNTEEQQLTEDGSGGMQLASTVASEGVPFAHSFTNRLVWRLLPRGGRSEAGQDSSSCSSSAADGAAGSTAPQPAALAPYTSRASTRLLLTARCAFHKRVLGPLRGQIEEQSLQGMRDAYARLAPLIQQQFCSGSDSSNSGGSPASVTNASQANCLSTGCSSGSSSGSGSVSASDGSAAWAAAQALARQHITGPAAADCLQQAEAAWPEWSAACCRLAPGPLPAGAQPSAEEAAAALQAVARRALSLPPAQRQQQLAKSRCVKGLVEVLRLTPPRHTAAAGGRIPSSAGGSGPSSSSLASGSGLQPGSAVAASLWALAVLGGSIWWEAEAEALCALLPACHGATLREASDAAWALATMRHYTPHLPLLEAAAAAALQQQLAGVQACAAEPPSGYASRGADSPSQPGRAPSLSQLASLLWGLATLGHRPLRLLPLLRLALQCQPGQLSFTALCTIAWSLAVAGCLQQPAAEAVAAALCSAAGSLPPAGAKRAALLQLHQFVAALQLAAQAEEGGASSATAQQQAQLGGAAAALHLLRQHAAVQPLLAAAASAWQAEGTHRGSKQVSAAQADVAATARALGMTVHEEHAAAGFSVDIAVPSRRLAIEVDGPTHFCRNAPPGGSEGSRCSSRGVHAAQASEDTLQPLGATLLKRRLLQRQGWAVVSVDAAQWERLRGAAQKRALLGAAIVAATAGIDVSMQQPAAAAESQP